MPWREWQRNGLLAVVSVGVVLLVGEGVARRLWKPGGYQSVIRADPVYGWTLDAGSHLHSIDSPRQLDYYIQVNALGMRDPERPAAKPAGMRRVLFIGDSMVFGTGVEVGERCGDVLGDRLGPEVEVLNAACGGWGTDQELLYLCREGFALQPDVVVLGLCPANDIVNNMLAHDLFGKAPKPRFELQDGRLVYIPPPARRPPSLTSRAKKFLKHSRLLHYVGHQGHVLVLRARPRPAVTDSVVYWNEDLEHDESHWSVFRTPYSPRFEAAFQITEALITAARDSCAARGIPFLLFAFPQKVEIDADARARELEYFHFEPEWFDLLAPYARFQRLADRLGCPFVSPLPEFQRARVPVFLPRDGHPNAAGHALAAEKLEPAVAVALGASWSAAPQRPTDERATR
jgi:lysophospholipase L1-like esterase